MGASLSEQIRANQSSSAGLTNCQLSVVNVWGVQVKPLGPGSLPNGVRVWGPRQLGGRGIFFFFSLKSSSGLGLPLFFLTR